MDLTNRSSVRLYLAADELDSAMDLWMRASRAFWRAGEAALAEHELGPAHFRALMLIRRAKAVSVGDLRAMLGVTKQSLARVLDEAEQAGLIQRNADPADARRRLLVLTSSGLAAEAATARALRAKIGAAFQAVGPEAAEGARAVLEALASSGADERDEA